MNGDILAPIERVKAGSSTLVAEVPQMVALIDSLDNSAALAECKAKVSAIAEYLAHRKGTTDAEYNAALKVKLKVEHRLGEVLRETVIDTKEGGDNVSHPLPDEITRKQSSRAQQFAKVSWEDVESAIDGIEGRASQAAVLRAIGVSQLTDEFEFCEEVIAIQKWLARRYQKWPAWAKPRFIDRLQFITEMLQEELSDGDGGGNREGQAEAEADNAVGGGAV